MIVACIDLQGGKGVQLVRGRRRELAVADVFGLLERFRRYRVLHVIDLDAAMGKGRNSGLVRELCRRARGKIRVGGGIRSVARAQQVLRWGADKVIIGSACFRRGKVNRQFLRRLIRGVGRERIMVALDTQGGRIVIRGWRERLQLRPSEVMPQLEAYCSEFLCTYVDREGTLRGTNLKWFRELRRASRLPITAAGGIRSRREVRALARLGMNAAIGMALYRDRMK